MTDKLTHPTIDVVIGSPREDFFQTVKDILKGYYPYQLKFFKSIDSLLETASSADFKPLLALIDGQDGSAAASEWVQSTKMNYSECALIVLHSAALPIDFKLVKKNGADEIMHIVFDREFISDTVLHLAPIDLQGQGIPISALMPIELKDLDSQTQINFDTYVHLPSNQKTVLWKKSGDIIDQKAIQKFYEMKQQMYIKKTQMKQFFEYAKTVLSKKNMAVPISMTEKFQNSKKAIYEIMSEFLNSETNDFQGGRIILEKCKKIIADFELTDPRPANLCFAEICRFAGNTRTPYHDCISVAAFAAHFAQMLDWSPEKIESAAMCGLLHNIGKAMLPVSAAEKDPQQLTAEELLEYKKYPERSVTLVKNRKVPLPPEISTAIEEHRELNNGLGFPKGLKGPDLSDLGKLLGIAFHFLEMTGIQEHQVSMTPKNALDEMKNDALRGAGAYDISMIAELCKKSNS